MLLSKKKILKKFNVLLIKKERRMVGKEVY
jgi:hypothetical protein